MTPEAHTLSLVLPTSPELLTLNSLFCTENTLDEGALCTDQAEVPASDVVPLACPKTSSQNAVALELTCTDCDAVHPLTGLVTVAV